jgi:anti-sigma factor RsiW
MTCADFVERVSGYLDDELEPAELLEFAVHRACCPGCRRYVDQMRRTLRLLRGLRASPWRG